jgi:DNA-directed RNA polymerase specialized sigma24 family protein
MIFTLNDKKYKYNGETNYSDIKDKLLKEISYLIKTIKGINYLTAEEKNDAITDIFINFFNAIERKNLDISNYDNYKNYLYLCVRNRIYTINAKKTESKKLTNEFFDFPQNDNFEFKIELAEKINTFTPEEKIIYDKLLQEKTYPIIAKELNSNKNRIFKIVGRIRKKLFPDFKGKIDKYSRKKNSGSHRANVKLIYDEEYNDFYAEKY